MKETTICKVRCLIKYPNNFQEDARHSLLIFLHGAGSRCEDTSKLLTNPFFAHIEKHNHFPFVVVAPLCTENTWFDMFERLEDVVRETAGYSFVDQNRIYLMGASMGGYGTWQLAMSMPEYFAAIVPICGGGMYWNAARLAGVPAWAFHGQKDTAVFWEESKKMVDAVNKNGGNAKLTIYPDNGHDAWSDTYSNPEVFSWLLQNKNTNLSDFADIYDNPGVYG